MQYATGTATVTDVLPTGLTFVSGTGTGWSCSAAGQTVTCANSAASIAVGADLPTLTLNVAVSGSAAASVQNTATVSHPMFDGTGSNQAATDTVTVLRSNLSTSTKTANVATVNPGDAVRYTITLKDTGSQGVVPTGISVVDDLPANVGSLSVISTPAGSTNLSVGSGGANGTGQVKVTGINLAAGGSATIVFDVTILGTATAGSTITNSATVSNPSGPGATPSVAVDVAASQPPSTGNKVLYLYDNLQLTRTLQASNTITPVTVTGGGATQTWTLYQGLPGVNGLSLPAQTVTATIRVGATNPARTLSAQLLRSGVKINTNADPTCNADKNTTTCSFSFTIPATTVATSGTLGLSLSTPTSGRDVTVSQRTAPGTFSSIRFTSNTVVNVDSVAFYSAAYPSTSTKTSWNPGDHVYVRAVVSDPFGGYDVSAANLTFTDPGSTIRVNNLAMTAKTSPTNDGATSTRIFEYDYTLPASPVYGNWVAAVTGVEGTETPAVTHTKNGLFALAPAALSIVKSHSGNFTAGSNAVYTLTVSNTSAGAVSGTTTVTDTLATGLTYVSGTGTNWTCGVAGQAVTCTSSAGIAGSTSMAPITLTVAVAGNMGTTVANTASVGNSTIASGFMTAGNTDNATILHPDLSTSTKTVVDTDGGDADPGDSLRYTITLKESAGVAASNIGVTDNISGSLQNFTVNAGLTTCNGTDASTSQIAQPEN